MSSSLRDRPLAETLCRDHHRVIPGTDAIGTEVALLDQLAEAVGNSSGRGSARGVSGSKTPLDIGAMELQQSISRRVPFSEGGLSRRAAFWLGGLSAGDYSGVEPLLAEWVDSIRALLDPPHQVALRGVHCSGCGYAQVLLPDTAEPGVDLQCPAILVSMTSPPTARCRVCGVDFDERGLHSLGDDVS